MSDLAKINKDLIRLTVEGIQRRLIAPANPQGCVVDLIVVKMKVIGILPLAKKAVSRLLRSVNEANRAFVEQRQKVANLPRVDLGNKSIAGRSGEQVPAFHAAGVFILSLGRELRKSSGFPQRIG